MLHEVDPKEAIFKDIGDLSDYDCGDELLVAIYQRPEKTQGGIVLVPKNREEDWYQSKAHLVVKVGSLCTFPFLKPQVGDWVVIRPSDANFSLDIRNVRCRHAHPKFVRAIIKDPTIIW